MTRIKKVLKWIGIGVGIAIAIVLILNAWFVGSTGARLEGKFAALRAAGEPLQLADLAREPIPPEKNAAVFLNRAADELASMDKELAAWFPKRVYPTEPLTTAEQEKMEKLFAAYSRVFPLIEQAAACPDYDPQLDYTQSPNSLVDLEMERVQKYRVLYRVLRAHSAWLVSKGGRDEAIATTILMLRLSRHMEREPLIVGYFVTVACKGVVMDAVNQALQAGSVSAASRRALDAELALHDNMDGYCRALISERAFALSSMRELPGYNFWLTRGFANDATLHLLELLEQHLANASRPFAEVVDKKDATASTPKPGGISFRAVVELLKPSLNKVREPAERVRAATRALRVLNALQASDMPEDALVKLTELGLPKEVTHDPFNGQPLRAKRLAEGWIVYSVGPNLVDDGGELDGRSDVGFGPLIPKNETIKP